MAESHSAARHSAHSCFGMESGRGCCGRKGICSQQGMSGFATVADSDRPAPSNNKMKLTKPARANMARSSQLILVFGRPAIRAQRGRWRRAGIQTAACCGLFCFSSSVVSAVTQPVVSLCSVVQSASSLDGKRVRIRAVYQRAFEISALSCPCAIDSRTWIGPGQANLPPSLAAALQRHKLQVFAAVEVEGKFRSREGPFGHLGFYPYSLEEPRFRRAKILLETDQLIGEPIALHTDVCRE